MKKGMRRLIFLTCILISALFSGCGSKREPILAPKKPVVVTFWHSYNDFAKSVIDEMILEFNDTIGIEKGIIIDAYGYGEQKKLENALYNSANKVMGAEAMPDMFISYSDNARRIDEYAPLVDLSQYFSEEELGMYRKEFLEEGIFGQGEPPRMIPVAKSTELVYVNTTDWQKFASESGRSDSEEELEATFGSWERIVEAAQLYYQWSGGKPMLGINLNNDIMYVTASQLSDPPFEQVEGKVSLRYGRDTAKKIWDTCYVPHIKGWFESSFYNQDAIKSGRLIAYIGSSAGSGYFPSTVTIDANNCYPINCSVVSYPAFSETTRYMAQRGANIAIVKTDEPHEYAAAEFIKWFTSEEESIKFAVSTGYIPVTNKALEDKDKIYERINFGDDNKEALNKSVAAALKAVETREFVIKRPFKNSYEVNSVFNNSLFKKIEMDLKEKKERILNGEAEQEVIRQLCGEENFDIWYNSLVRDIETNLK